VRAGFRIGEVPVPTRYFAEASSVNFRRSVLYGLGTLRTLLRHHTSPSAEPERANSPAPGEG